MSGGVLWRKIKYGKGTKSKERHYFISSNQ